MPDPDTVEVGNTTYYIDSEGFLHSTPQEAVEANLQIESVQGQYVTGGNCGQDPSNIPIEDEPEENN